MQTKNEPNPMDWWKVVGGIIAIFGVFSATTASIVSVNTRLTGIERDIFYIKESLNEQREFIYRANQSRETSQLSPPAVKN